MVHTRQKEHIHIFYRPPRALQSDLYRVLIHYPAQQRIRFRHLVRVALHETKSRLQRNRQARRTLRPERPTTIAEARSQTALYKVTFALPHGPQLALALALQCSRLWRYQCHGIFANWFRNAPHLLMTMNPPVRRPRAIRRSGLVILASEPSQRKGHISYRL